METREAIGFIETAIPASDDTQQQWADLGCGSGTFTRALSHLLPTGSGTTAVDRSPQALESVMGNEVSVKFHQADFGTDGLRLPKLKASWMSSARRIAYRYHIYDGNTRWIRHRAKIVSPA